MSEHTAGINRRTFITGAAVIGAAAVVSTVNPVKAHAVTAAEKKAEATAALSKLQTMEDQLAEASENYENALAEQAEAQAKMDEAQGRIDEASGRISELQSQLGTRARSMYRTGSSSFIDLLLGATSFTAFTNNWGILNNMNETDANLVNETKELRAEVEEQKRVFSEEEARAAEEASRAAEVKEEAEALVVVMQDTYNQLSAEAQQLYQQEAAAREKAAIAAANAQAAASNGGGGGAGGGYSGGYSGGGGGGVSYNDAYVSSVDGGSVLDRAYSQLGVTYVYGTGIAGVSWDCSGLVGYALTGGQGHSMGSDQSIIGSCTAVSEPQPGDVCWRPGHVGIYIGNGQMIHAPQTGDVVKVSNVSDNMSYYRY